VPAPGPYIATSFALAGFAVFAAVHHLHLWYGRRERPSLLFAAYSVAAAVVCAAHAAAAGVTTAAAGQLALNLRTTFGLVAFIVQVPLIETITGRHAPRYRALMTALLGGGLFVNVFVEPIIGTVTAVERMTLPWGEIVTTLTRMPSEIGVISVLPRILYLGIVTVQIYAIVAARPMFRHDRTAAWLITLAGATGLVGTIVGLLVDTQVLRWPYLGQIPVAIWVVLMAVLLSRDHLRRGDRLRASEASLAAVVANSPGVAIQWYDVDGRVVLWNRASEQMFGYRATEAIGKTLDALTHTPAQFAAFRESLATIARSGQSIGPSEFTFLREGRETRTGSSTLFQIPAGADGQPRFVGMVVDITERTRAELALAVSEARYRTLIQSAPEAIVVFDVERSVFTDVNERACALFGVPPETLKTLNPVRLSPELQPDGRRSAHAAEDYLERAIAGETPRFEWIHRTPAGQDIPCEIRLVRLPDPTRILIRGSILEISERLALEQQLRQSQKMQAIGQLAGGIAHDFNNLLTVISSAADLLRHDERPDDPRLASITAIQDAAKRAAWLTGRLLAFSRRAAHAPQVVELDGVTRDAEGMLRRLIGEDVELTVTLRAANKHVRIDPGQWSQVLMNLAINARDAMPRGGHLEIATETVEVADNAGHPGVTAGQYVSLSVADNGLGMSPEVRARLFEPFFSTKPLGQGTGLGLAVVHGIVEQAGGFITVDSAPEAGARFAIYLPLVTAAAPVMAPPAAVASPAAARLRGSSILLAEDDDSVRRLIEAALLRHGAVVTSARNGLEARQFLETSGATIDLLVTDVVMPGLYGHQLAAEARARHPHLKTLYMSGYLDEVKLPLNELDQSQAFLQKPFSMATLAAAVLELLERGSARPAADR
jgi:two-component system cell cycle sensor histidine kinase/response regulator CckA